ncbi:MAG TPA: aminotransferase class V-fold PLP-dependent enzyme [Anaerovoracaceae bacterium]|nr:aminotransferase class V-fold PLP-dependent enzyme [Anaerovoracaceae bacterium]
MKELFLDANAHIPVNELALKTYTTFSNSKAGHGHPSSLSEPGRLAAAAMEEARDKIAKLIGATSANQIIFTSSCTQACEWALQILSETSSEIWVSPTEHTAIKDAVEKYAKKINIIPVNDKGVVDCENDYPVAVCTHMQNEIGIIQPIDQLKSKYVLSDMSQSVGKIDINVSKLNIDMAVFGGHKFGGPGGIGFIYLKDPTTWRPFGTGSRYFMDRTGTPDVAGIVATAVALEDAIATLPYRQINMTLFQGTLEAGLKTRGHEIIGTDVRRAWNTTFFNLPNKAMHAIMALGEKGIHVGLGSACGSMHAGPSPLMKVLGRQGSVHDYIRVSQWGEYNDKDAEHFLNVLDALRL